MTDDDVEEFVREFADGLSRRDETACASRWGRGWIVVADGFEAVADDPTELEPFLAQAWPFYDFLDVARVDHRILERADLSESLARVTVRYSFHDGAGAHLTDGDFEYVLRRGENGLRCHVGVNIDTAANVVGLAYARGYPG